jgi:two-component system response regulator (stage 0 sporulation protein F)
MSDKPIILYVDDELINLKVFEINLSKKYHVLTSESVLKGLEILDTFQKIKVVVSDMRMPQMNGIEFIKKAKSKYPDIGYFILTGYEITNEIQEAIDNGLIQRYFCKPFNMKEISSIIESTLSN